MRRALAKAGIVGALALTPLAAVIPAHAAPPVQTQPQDSVDIDEPALPEDGEDDSGKYGLIGLSGMLGLFGYKKYRDHKAAQGGTRVGGVDTDGSGSKRI